MPTIDRWVIDNVFQHLNSVMVENQNTLSDHFTCSINLSGTTLNDDHFVDFIRNLIDRYELPPNNICFEITETAAIANLTKASRFIHQLKEAGFRFALDDFGVGFSSYGYLKNLPIDYIKIDGAKVFVEINLGDTDEMYAENIRDEVTETLESMKCLDEVVVRILDRQKFEIKEENGS